ncbi:hypothetical protein [Arthrobacter castelli]|uniref:hypothetical protein n=1 Tax=Arthrobacter castelli TaxID=271431 RepID=UPI000415D3AC|nr:hypothetical protein [Arthrobacter castelli]
MSSAPERRPVTIRRAPKIIPFLVLGALLALIAAGIIAFTGPEGDQFSRGTVLGFFSALLLIPGLLLGAAVALLLDWISVRRSRQALAERTGSEAADEPDPDAAATGGPGPDSGTAEAPETETERDTKAADEPDPDTGAAPDPAEPAQDPDDDGDNNR